MNLLLSFRYGVNGVMRFCTCTVDIEEVMLRRVKNHQRSLDFGTVHRELLRQDSVGPAAGFNPCTHFVDVVTCSVATVNPEVMPGWV